MERSSASSKTPCRLAVFPGLWPALHVPGAAIDPARLAALSRSTWSRNGGTYPRAGDSRALDP